MDEIIRVNTIDQYTKLYGLETIHPLVGVVDLTKASTFPNHVRMNMGVLRSNILQIKYSFLLIILAILSKRMWGIHLITTRN